MKALTVNYFQVEKGSITLAIHHQDGKATYQAITNPDLIAWFKQAAPCLAGQPSQRLELTLQGEG